mmetsp:Transcript_22864/g.58473  ORF Transcript_22864/g.58473 Transcript_22864/m.58473 type:complete len:263 (+) Transcript_22864:102-890(+)
MKWGALLCLWWPSALALSLDTRRRAPEDESTTTAVTATTTTTTTPATPGGTVEARGSLGAVGSLSAGAHFSMELLEAEAASFNSTLSGVNNTLTAALAQVEDLKGQLEAVDSSVVEIDAGGLNASTAVKADAAQFAEVGKTVLALNTSDLPPRVSALLAKVAALKTSIEGKPSAANAAANGDDPDLETRIDRMHLAILANASTIKYDTFGRLAAIDRVLFVNTTLMADRVMRRRISEELQRAPMQLAAELTAFMDNLTKSFI